LKIVAENNDQIINRMFFVAVQYWMYGNYFFSRFRDFVMTQPILEMLYNYHVFISFSFFIIGVHRIPSLSLLLSVGSRKNKQKTE